MSARHTVPSFFYISKHVDISVNALRMTASLFSTRENVHREIYYHPQGSPFKVDTSVGDLFWKLLSASEHPQKCPLTKFHGTVDYCVIELFFFYLGLFLFNISAIDLSFFNKSQ